jgi:hypothetical protein
MGFESLVFDYILIVAFRRFWGDEVTNITFCQTVRSLAVLLRLLKARIEGRLQQGLTSFSTGATAKPQALEGSSMTGSSIRR